jgi:hypothetical protein
VARLGDSEARNSPYEFVQPEPGRHSFPNYIPSGYKCCQLEVNLLNAFQKESGNIPLYNGYPGPNSNTFVFTIVSEAGGSVQFPNTAYG